MMNLHTEEEDPVKLLRFSEKEYIKSKQSTLPTIIFYGMEVLGWHIAPVVRCLVSKVKNTSNGLSSFPVGLEHLCLSNYKLVECFASVGLLERTLGKLSSKQDMLPQNILGILNLMGVLFQDWASYQLHTLIKFGFP